MLDSSVPKAGDADAVGLFPKHIEPCGIVVPNWTQADDGNSRTPVHTPSDPTLLVDISGAILRTRLALLDQLGTKLIPNMLGGVDLLGYQTGPKPSMVSVARPS